MDPLLYSKDYFEGQEYRSYIEEKAIHQRNFKARVAMLQRWKPKGGTLLEIGSAYGLFLDVAKAHWNVRGVDITAEGVDHTRTVLHLPAQRVEFLDVPEERESQDIICLWDTLEHLSRPIAVIEKAARWLKPGGLLVLTTPDIGSRLARWRKTRWRQIHPPSHLFYFPSETLQRAFKKAGLEVFHQEHVGYCRSFRTMAHNLFCLPGKTYPWLYPVLTMGGRLDFPVYLNLFDTLLIAGRKAGK